MIWGLWITVYVVNNGLVTWLPTLYRQVFKLPLETSLLYGWITSAVGVVASLICALYIDKVGRKRWYAIAFLLATVPLVILTALGATTATQVVILAPIAYAILQTIAFSLYLYSAELYPTRLRAVGTGFGSAWLRAGSSIGPVMVGFIVAGVGIRYVFLAFAVIALIGGLITARFGIETKGKVLEELSPDPPRNSGRGHLPAAGAVCPTPDCHEGPAMTIFAVTYKYSDDVATRDALRTEHRDYLRGLADQGLLLVSGPFGPDEPAGALLLFRADDKAHVDALVDKDPFTASGVIADAATAEWEPVIGPLLPAL